MDNDSHILVKLASLEKSLESQNISRLKLLVIKRFCLGLFDVLLKLNKSLFLSFFLSCRSIMVKIPKLNKSVKVKL